MVEESSLHFETPLSIEQVFRTLSLHLSYPRSARRHLLEIGRFIRRIMPECQLFESYILEIAQRLPDIVARLNLLGTDPAQLRPLYDDLKELIVKLPSLSGVKGLAGSLQRMRLVLASLYHFVGDASQGSEFEMNEPSPVGKSLADLRAESLLIPVIERNLVDLPREQEKESGYLRRISIDITGSALSEADEFHTQVLLLGQDGGLTNTITTPIEAARTLLVHLLPQLEDKYFRGYVTFDEMNAFHQGSSANVAIAALFYCSILKHIGAREHFRLADHVTMTGDISNDASILPVDPDSLRLKTEAVFFSTIQYFVVPKQQAPIAEEILHALHLRYPKRQLKIIGLGTLQEVFYDRRLSVEIKASALEHGMRKLWNYKIPLGSTLIIAALLLILIRNTIPPANNNPVSAKFQGQKMLIKNDEGETLEEIDVGLTTVQRAKRAGSNPDANAICKFFDIDGDGKNEYIYSQFTGPTSEEINSLVCRSLWKKVPHWEIGFQEPFSFPNDPVDQHASLIINSFIVGTFEGNGIPEVFVAAHHPFFPSKIYKMNALDGRILGSFLNVGHLGLVATQDIQGDGVKEIFLAGWNNAFDASVLLVFDPRFISGSSPARDKYLPTNESNGTEMYYILLPRTPLLKPLQESSVSAGPQEIEFDAVDSSTRLTVADLTTNTTESNQSLVGALTYTFDKSMTVENVSSSSGWDAAATLLVHEHKLRRVPSATYLNSEYKKWLKYWNGTGWQRSPVLNAGYLKALETLQKSKE